MIVATACASPTVSPTPPDRSAGAEAEVCQLIDLFTPSGERVDLTGTWQDIGGGPFYYVDQDGDCIRIVGEFVSAEGGERFTLLKSFGFDGHLRPDFTLQGRWVFLNLLSQYRYSGTGSWALDVGGDPWTLRGPPVVSDQTGRYSLTLERVTDRWLAP